MIYQEEVSNDFLFFLFFSSRRLHTRCALVTGVQTCALPISLADYDGYGSCPLTVEQGKIVLAEFGYGGKPLPSFPTWLIDGARPSRLSWLLKKTILPPVYWHAMLKGREWMVKPHMISG